MVDDSFWRELESEYGSDWSSEGPAIKARIEGIFAAIESEYEADRPIGVGGGGVAIRVINKRLGSHGVPQYAVLKLARPVSERAHQLNSILGREIERLTGLRHQNLVRIQTHGDVGGEFFYIMDYLDGSGDADKALAADATMSNLLRMIKSAVDGIAYLHQHNIAHLDIKPANIFASRDEVTVADLGFAKRTDKSGKTQYLGGTRGYMHPDHVRLLESVSSSDRDIEETARQTLLSATEIDPVWLEWDIYSLGVTVLVLLRVLDVHAPSLSSTYDYRYLKLMAHRMLGRCVREAVVETEYIREHGLHDPTGRRLVEEMYLGLDYESMRELSYRSMDDVKHDLAKLLGTENLLRDVPELETQLRDVIQAASHAPVPFSGRVRAVLDSREMRSLSTVDQLGLVRLVYPSASHSRLEHSLGTMAMSARYARALYSDPTNPLFRQIMNASDLTRLLCVALVHDVGHYPLAHDLEEVDREIFSHERRTAQLLADKNSHVTRALGEWGLTGDDLVSILKSEDAPGTPLRGMIVRSIIDGPIDADKLDYLIRDSENLRLPYGAGIDVEKLLQALTVVVSHQGSTVAGIGIFEKGRIPAESLAFARYALYGSVYWHRTHRTLKAMLSRVGYEALHATKAGNQQYRSELRASLDRLLAQPGIEQPELELGIGRSRLDPSPYLDSETQRVVNWLFARVGNEEFRGLADDLLQRRLYSRVLVLTRARGDIPDRRWEQIEGIFGRIGRRWEERREVTVALQTRVAELVAGWDGAARPGYTGVMKEDALDFVSLAHTKPLVLIDYPPTKSGATSALKYLREGELLSPSGELRVDGVEESSLWSALVSQHAMSLGKLRVYIHPDHARTVVAAIGREGLLNALLHALNQVRNV